MPSNHNLSEASLLIQYETALQNTLAQTDIANSMSEFGYDDPIIQEGKSLLNIAKQEFQRNKDEDNQTRESSKVYKDKSKEIYDKFRLDRKKARVIFRNAPEILKDLACMAPIPNSWANRIQTYESFYETALKAESVKTKLLRLKVTEQDLNDGITLINEAKQARFEYYKEVGESEQVTKDKDLAIGKLDDWMTEFYMVAKIALEDKPQLMEALGRSVKS